jgi:hypothetical protein
MLEELLYLDHGRLGLLLGFVAVIGAFTTFVLSVIAVQMRKGKEAALNAQLKLQLLDQNFSAEEISQIVEAGRGKNRRDWRATARMIADAQRRNKVGCGC